MRVCVLLAWCVYAAIHLDDQPPQHSHTHMHTRAQVFIQGTFNNWERQIPMHRSGNDFTYICNLKRGKHAFKFIVDDEWRCVCVRVSSTARECVSSHLCV